VNNGTVEFVGTVKEVGERYHHLFDN
jgi:hypothetical protein